jgi:transposase
MTTSPYSIDLREKVIKYIESGKKQKAAAEVFSINISTVNKWWLRYRKEGHFLPRKRKGAVSKIDKEELIKYITVTPNARLSDMSKKFGISIWGIYYWLGKLGYSYKKKPSPMWKLMNSNERTTKKL